MPTVARNRTYSARARLIAGFVVLAIVLGGGGSPNPLSELILDILFAVTAVAWVWLGASGTRGGDALRDRLALVVVAIPLVIPLVQLIPLPPSIWTGLPGRSDELAALSLIGEQSSWRPISLSPSRTIASLIAIVPAVFCFYAVARLDYNERRLILVTVVAMCLLSAWLGAVQLTDRGRGFNFYSQHTVGWITGFQANRNAAADVFLIGTLSLSAVAMPYFAGYRKKLPLGLAQRAFGMVIGGICVFLLAATAMTGSRAGVALILVALAGVALTYRVSRAETGAAGWTKLSVLLLVVALLVAAAAAFFALSQNTQIARLTERFSDLGDERTEIWQDSWFALKQYWPVGFGLGGFEPAMFPAERLEYLDALVPNRAHNDFLEIGIEAGMLGYAMIVAAAVAVMALALRAWREPRLRGQIVFGLSVLLLIALHSVVDYPDASFRFDHRDENVRAREHLRQVGKGDPRVNRQVAQALFLAVCRQSVGHLAFRKDMHLRAGQLAGEGQQQPGIVLVAERAGIDDAHAFTGHVGLGPIIVARIARQLVERSPVLDYPDFRRVNAFGDQDRAKILGNRDDMVAFPQHAKLERAVLRGDQVAEKRELARHDPADRFAVDVLQPEDELRPAIVRCPLEQPRVSSGAFDEITMSGESERVSSASLWPISISCWRRVKKEFLANGRLLATGVMANPAGSSSATRRLPLGVWNPVE
jgi:O-antigen ligase